MEVKTPLAATRLILENHPSEITRAMDEEMQQINYYLSRHCIMRGVIV